MKSREEAFAGRIKVLLDQAATDLRPGLGYRLQQARAQALGRLADNRQTERSGRLVGAHGLVGAGAAGGSLPDLAPPRPLFAQGRVWAGIAAIAVAAFGWQQWQAWQDLAEVEDLDAQILTSDLPIDAFVDRGFQLFLTIPPALPEPAAPAEGEAAAAPEGEAPAVAGSEPTPRGAAAKPAE